MNIRTKIYILQSIFTLIVLSFMSFIYINYEEKYYEEIDTYVDITAQSYAKETLLSLQLVDHLNENNKELFYRINQEAKVRIESDNTLSLELLKQELIEKYNLSDINIELYMVNKNFVIYDTTFEPDLGFDLSIAADTQGYINQCNAKDGIYFVNGVIYDAIDKQHKIYTFTKIKKDTYLEMGFIDKRFNEFYLNSFQAKENKNKTNVYIVITLEEFQHYFALGVQEKQKSKKDFFDTMDRFENSIPTKNPIINAVRNKKEIRIERGSYIYVYKSILSNKDMSILRDEDVVVEIVVDISNIKKEFIRFKSIFFLIVLIVSALFLFIFIWTKFYITRPRDCETTKPRSS